MNALPPDHPPVKVASADTHHHSFWHDAGRWLGAGILVLTVHAAGAYAIHMAQEEDQPDGTQVAAMVVELAPEPEAPMEEQVAEEAQPETAEAPQELAEPAQQPEPVQEEPTPPEPEEATAFGGKNRLRGSRRLSHETENLVLLGRSGLLVRLLRGVVLLVSLSLLRMMLGNSRVRCSSRSSVSSACRQDRSGQAQNSGHTKSRNKRLLHFPVPQLGFPFGVFPAGGKALSCPPVSAMSGLIPRSLRASA